MTSPQAAALRDILHILRRRHHSASVVIFPAQVQGEAAASEVSAGIRHFNQARNVEVIIVARGGGSAEDLAAFNHEGLARTIASSSIPVISAVGHETDFTIVDFVADLRAPTPSAAAELVIRSRQEVEEQLEGLHARLGKGIRYRLLIARQSWTELARHTAFPRLMDFIHRRQQRLDDLTHRLAEGARRNLENRRRRFEFLSASVRHYDARRVLGSMRKDLEARTVALVSGLRSRLRECGIGFERVEAAFRALSPLAILARGYALVFDDSGALLKDASQVNAGDQISARLAQGTLIATVNGKRG